MPFVCSMDSEPSKTQTKGYHSPEEENPWSPFSVVCHATKDQEKDDLNGKTDAIAQKDDRIDRSTGAKEFQSARVSTSLVKQILKGSGCKVEQCQSVVAYSCYYCQSDCFDVEGYLPI